MPFKVHISIRENYKVDVMVALYHSKFSFIVAKTYPATENYKANVILGFGEKEVRLVDWKAQ